MCLTDLANPQFYRMSAQGFEPRTHALEGRCSIQLSYAPTLIVCFMERETRFELATSTLARLRSTTELFPHMKLLNKLGADEGSRTPTPKALDPKSSASANSATSAHYSLFTGGGWWIRTTEVGDNRFTVCPLWPLGKSSVELVIGIEPTTC